MNPDPPPERSWIRDREIRKRLLTGGRGHLAPKRRKELRSQRPQRRFVVARHFAGWIVLVVGIAGIVLPLTPAVILIPAGVALIGRDQWVIRRTRVAFRLALRRAEDWSGGAGSVGRLARKWERRFGNALRARRMRSWERRRPNPQPRAIG